jgi:surface antigen
MTMKSICLAATVAAVALTGCQTMGPKQTIGGLGGGLAGGLIGSQIGRGEGNLLAVGIGTLAGAWLGSEVGASLDRADQAYLATTSQNAFESYPTGRTASWSNPDTGHYGSITPTHTYVAGNGQNCREFQQTIYISGQAQTGNGTACRNANGTWQIM